MHPASRYTTSSTSLYSGSSLIAVCKDDYQKSTRLMVAGEVVWLLLNRVCMMAKQEDTRTNMLVRRQYGVGVGCGAETIIHIFRPILNSHPYRAAHKIDVANTFNTMNCETVFAPLRDSPSASLTLLIAPPAIVRVTYFGVQVISLPPFPSPKECVKGTA